MFGLLVTVATHPDVLCSAFATACKDHTWLFTDTFSTRNK
jgi:hypothetical protein